MKEKTEIKTILNRYKDNFEDFVNSSDIEPSNMLRPVDKRLCNVMFGFENFLTKPKLDKKILDVS